MTRYPEEILHEDCDDGTMVNNVDNLKDLIIGRKIVSVETRKSTTDRYYNYDETVITLDDGRQVMLVDSSDCCAFTELEAFLLHPDKVDHAILGVGTMDDYHTWHIYADYGDILELTVGWSCGNPFYYGYGFNIKVKEVNS